MANVFAIRGKLDGLESVLAKLRLVKSGGFRGRMLKKALRKGAKLLAKLAKANLKHSDTGALRLSIGAKVVANMEKGFAYAIIGPRRKFAKNKLTGKSELTKFGRQLEARGIDYNQPAYYAHLVEFGTQAHAIGKGSSIRKEKQVGRLHPGAAPKPFMRPAYDQGKSRAVEIIRASIEADLVVAVTKGRMITDDAGGDNG